MDFQLEGTKYHVSVPRTHVFDTWHKYLGTYSSMTEVVNKVCEDLINELPDNQKENIDVNPLENRVKYICKKIKSYWDSENRMKSRVLKAHAGWFEVIEKIELLINKPSASTSKPDVPAPESGKKRGRPKIPFAESSKRTKQRKIASWSRIDETLASSLSDSSIRSDLAGLDDSEALFILVEAKLTKKQYNVIREALNNKYKNLLPTYKRIAAEKNKSYPCSSKITVTDSSAEVELQSLLDHTASRILESQKSVLFTLPDDSSTNLVLVGKWGFDGTTGQSEYKQAFSDPNIDTDSNLFVTSYVPLQLLIKNNEGAVSSVVWKNPCPASTRYCRPIRFQFLKETSEVSRAEEEYFNNKYSALQTTKFNICGKDWAISHDLRLTMVDGKVCNALSETASSMRCYLCGVTPKDMNDIEACLIKPVKREYFTFGLSPLHAWIRFFEFFIHISYRLDIKKWRVDSKEDKQNVATRKATIQKVFRERLGLIVDKPKSGGSGTSNDGNTARKFFLNPSVSSEITGIDEEIIKRCAIILKVLASGYKVNTEKFHQYSVETAKNIVDRYPWYKLSASVHKILIHGALIIEHHALISIGELSEEAAEARNKDIKAYRLRHTRKFSRKITNTDLLNRLLLTSDPFISEMRKLPPKNKSALPKSVIDLLVD